ncbi:MAG: hypothetical protein SPI62_01705 [Candidatus Enteromonas sp.]|nr:hypothetical protein [Candidatus Enteromonas sp.]
MKLPSLFPTVRLENVKCFPQSKSLGLDVLRSAFISLSSSGGFLCVGVDESLECLGFPLLDLPAVKRALRTGSLCLGDHPKLKISVQNIDSKAEKCVLLVEVGQASQSSGLLSPAELDGLSCFLRWCEENGAETPDIERLKKWNLVDSRGRATGGFSLFSDDGKATLECHLYKGKEKTGPLLDERTFTGPIQDCLRGGVAFLERDTKASSSGGQWVGSYPKNAFLFSLMKLFVYRDYLDGSMASHVDIFDDRVELSAPIHPLEDGVFPPINQEIEQGFSIAGLPNAPLYQCYENKERRLYPSVNCTREKMTIVLKDELYREAELPVSKKEPLTDDQLKVIRTLAKGPSSLYALMLDSPYKSRAAFTKYVIAPLMANRQIERVGKLTSPKAVLKLV